MPDYEYSRKKRSYSLGEDPYKKIVENSFPQGGTLSILEGIIIASADHRLALRMIRRARLRAKVYQKCIDIENNGGQDGPPPPPWWYVLASGILSKIYTMDDIKDADVYIRYCLQEYIFNDRKLGRKRHLTTSEKLSVIEAMLYLHYKRNEGTMPDAIMYRILEAYANEANGSED